MGFEAIKARCQQRLVAIDTVLLPINEQKEFGLDL